MEVGAVVAGPGVFQEEEVPVARNRPSGASVHARLTEARVHVGRKARSQVTAFQAP
jgi:hypothetical protein